MNVNSSRWLVITHRIRVYDMNNFTEPDDVVSLNRIAYSSKATVNPGIRQLKTSKHSRKSHGFVRNAKQSLRHS